MNLLDLFRRKPLPARPAMAEAYLRTHQVFVCAQSRTTAGVWIWAEPFCAVDAADRDGLGEALRITLNASRAQVPHSAAAEVTAPMLKLAAVGSFNAFAAGARCVQIERQDGRIRFTPTRNGGRGEGFVDLREHSITAEEPDDPVDALMAAFDASA